MLYQSTRSEQEKISSAQAIKQGIAADGGLFVPTEAVKINLTDLINLTYPQRAALILGQYLGVFSASELAEVTAASYQSNFADPQIAPIKTLSNGANLLELWHGPTCAFKDLALQILPRLLTTALAKTGEKAEIVILVATSGDTGKAALEGFKDVPGTRIMVFFPNQGVSQVQKLQMQTQEGSNVSVAAVEGNFDDAQSGVKAIFTNPAIKAELAAHNLSLSSANSINWGRLAPQIVYYFSAYLDLVQAGRLKMGDPLNFVVPTGNFGDILAGYYAKQAGLPVGKLICASNDNKILTDFF
ncbi:MAG: threonine synthase, partial [Clostridia bacterium]|nr:threonine synthase [Clostridia bacterium]